MSETIYRFFSRVMASPFMWASALTVAFYGIIAQEAMQDTWLRRYTTEHTVEYFITAFFIWGLTEVAFRVSNYPREWRSLAALKSLGSQVSSAGSDAAAWQTQLAKQPAYIRESRYAQRLSKALTGLRSDVGTAELREHLGQLAEQDHECAHTNYALVRFIVWLAPVLGFLGTVIHFGTALSGLSPETIADQLSHIVGEMGTAFNTTTTALAASTTMMFALFLGERMERSLVQAIDERVEHELLEKFAVRAGATPSGTSAESSIKLDATLAPHAASILQAVERMMQHSGEIATRQLTAWRDEFAQFNARAAEQRELMQAALAQTSGQTARLDATARKLAELLEDHGQLNVIQDGLSRNLKSLHDTQQLDQVVHQLTAAVHLLTARHRPAFEANPKAA